MVMTVTANILPTRRYPSAIYATVAVCTSDCQSRISVETDERIEPICGTVAILGLSYTVLERNSGISRNNGTSLWNFVPNSGLKHFATHVDRRKYCLRSSTDDRRQFITTHLASIFVYNMIGVTQRVARVRRRQLRFVNPLMHKVAKMITWNNAVRRHTGVTMVLNFDVRAIWRSDLLGQYGAEPNYSTLPFWQLCALKG